MKLLSNLISAIYVTAVVRGHPVGEKETFDPVTEHFARSRPGTVPRISASLFSSLQDFGSVIEKVNTSQSKSSDRYGENVEASETKSLDTVSEQVDSSQLENGGQITNNEDSYNNKNYQFSIEEDVKSFTAYPLPPSSLILSDSKPTTNNPLDNLKDFPTWRSTEIHDIPGNHENEIVDNESIYIDQLAVESEQSQHSVAPTIVKNHSATLPEEVSLATTDIALSDPESNYSDLVTTGSSNSENRSQIKVNLSLTPTSVKFNDRISDEAVTNPTFDIQTTSTTPVPVHANYIPVKNDDNEDSNENQRIVEQVTPGTLSIVEVNRADVSEPETTPEAILHIEDDDRNMTEIPSGFLSTEAAPLVNDALAVQNTTEMTIPTQLNIYEYTTNFENTEVHANNISEEKDVEVPGIEKEESKDLETMYYSDIYAISTMQPVHEYTFYATTEEDNTEEDQFAKEKEKDFNLIKEEIETSSPKTVMNGDAYELATVIPSYDVHEYIVPKNEDYEYYSPAIEYDDKSSVHSMDAPTYDDESETERTDYPSLDVSTYKLNPETDDPSDQNEISDLYEIESSDSSDSTTNILIDDFTTDSSSVTDFISEPSLATDVKDVAHPLLTLMKIKPHSMKLLIKPSKFYPNTKVRLMYERVRRTRPPLLHHLDNPVKEIVNLYKEYQEHELSNLPIGKYIVCGDAQINGQVFQTNCFETVIDKLDNNQLQVGVIAVIAVALLIVFAVVVYAVFHKTVLSKRKRKERELQEKVDQFARREKERHEKQLLESPVIAVTYPDPNEPFEERCIM
eukprot:GFUD01014391.1.p1 GENE.GFUD01014391.1~~GFUD01014391.1.p1  ORF type:complete len:795 (-),score=178.71 GFUD01014391.1:57-2441(-)